MQAGVLIEKKTTKGSGAIADLGKDSSDGKTYLIAAMRFAHLRAGNSMHQWSRPGRIAAV